MTDTDSLEQDFDEQGEWLRKLRHAFARHSRRIQKLDRELAAMQSSAE